ncbi:MAG: arginine deiminase-related protein [Phycisphaerales bacterium]
MTAERAQRASRVLMIRPSGFRRDHEAAQTNSYMQVPTETADRVREQAKAEFDAVASALRDAGIGVLVFEDEIGLPDSVFPNNWISFHQPAGSRDKSDAVVVTYPMLPEARRRERRVEILDAVARFTGTTPDHIDLSTLEQDGEFLEGTGSLVLDRVHGKAYACVSGRTTDQALDTWADEMGYEVVRFHAADQGGNPVYHTNVIMSIGEKLAVACLESITDPDEYDAVEASLRQDGRDLMTITLDQVAHFCGNILELQNRKGESVFAMSKSAYEHFTPSQRERFESLGRVVRVAIPTIEYVAGGSVRCMLAELGN